jgi:hypothetical protein
VVVSLWQLPVSMSVLLARTVAAYGLRCLFGGALSSSSTSSSQDLPLLTDVDAGRVTYLASRVAPCFHMVYVSGRDRYRHRHRRTETASKTKTAGPTRGRASRWKGGDAPVLQDAATRMQPEKEGEEAGRGPKKVERASSELKRGLDSHKLRVSASLTVRRILGLNQLFLTVCVGSWTGLTLCSPPCPFKLGALHIADGFGYLTHEGGDHGHGLLPWPCTNPHYLKVGGLGVFF